MGKHEQEELRRLEEALMESDDFPEDPEDELDILEDIWQEISDLDYEIYNTDDTDVDLEAYSEDIHQGSSRSSSVLLKSLLVILLFVAVFSLLKLLGVL